MAKADDTPTELDYLHELRKELTRLRFEVDGIYEADVERRTWGPEFSMALLEAQRKAKRVPADGTHYDGYPYSSLHIITDQLGKVLQEHELTVELVHSKIVDETELETKGGGVMWMTDVRATFHVTHGPTGQWKEYVIVGRRSNDKDKSVGQATTSAFTMFLPRLLNVTTGEVDENTPLPDAKGSRNRRSGGGGGSPRRQQQPPPQQQRAPAGGLGSKGWERDRESWGWACTATGELVPTCAKCDAPAPGGSCMKPDCDGKGAAPRNQQSSSSTAAPKEEPKKQAAPAAESDDEKRKRREGQTLRELKVAYGRKLGRVEPWEEEALFRAYDQVPNDIAEWDADHFRLVDKLFKAQSVSVVLSQAAKRMAEKEPAEKEAIESLRERATALGPMMMGRAEVAIASGWKYAVDELLDVVAAEELRREADGS